MVIITLLVFFWPIETEETHLHNQFFIFYYPMVLAFGFVMPRRIEIVYTVVAILLYTLVVASSLDVHSSETGNTAIQINLKTLLFRIIVMGAMGGLGNYYWRIQRRRRQSAVAGDVQP